MSVSSVGSISMFQEEVRNETVGGEVFMDYVPKTWGPIAALHLIALGTGGIKPCVSSFGGDQFQAHEVSSEIAAELIWPNRFKS